MTAPTTLNETAFAKLNLSLGVLGRRVDGFHELTSLVAFTAFGDELSLSPGPGFKLEVEGPFGHQIEGDNLVERVARYFMRQSEISDFGCLRLTKNLPVAAGLGGGSADAGAFIRLVGRVKGQPFSDQEIESFGALFGADVPICVHSRPARITGIGEQIGMIPYLPKFGVLLVNPGVPMLTAAVFKAANAPAYSIAGSALPPLPNFRSENLITYMKTHPNDLSASAITLQPVIGDVIAALADLPGCLIARMSGSGATCFGLFETEKAARSGGDQLSAMQPDWWIKTCSICPA